MGFRLRILLIIILSSNIGLYMTFVPSQADVLVSSSSTIEFSGYTWKIKESGAEKWGPGPNNWDGSNQSVWKDNENQLHLKIRNIGGIWHCSEVYTQQSLGYGKYTFTLASGFENLDPNIVLGLFTYFNDTQEIDIEYSRWGDENANNGQFVIQPSITTNIFRYPINNSIGSSKHSFIWTENCVQFESSWISNESTQELIRQSWNYTGFDNPIPRTEHVHINLWLMKGYAPNNTQEAEVIIEEFRFEPISIFGNITCPPINDATNSIKSYSNLTFITGALGIIIIIKKIKKKSE